MVRARRRFLGAAQVDAAGRVRPDRVVLSWFGCSSFVLAIGGRVLLLDAWVPRGVHSGYVPVDVEELSALRPSHVLIGHGHFDHAADAPTVALGAGATVVGTAAHCAQAAAHARREGGRAIRTRAVVPGRAPGERGSLRIGPVRVDALSHVHSAARAPAGGGAPSAPLVPTPDLLPCLEHPPTLEDALDLISHQPDQEGGTLVYRLRFRDFALVWHDSSGPVAAEAPQVLAAMRRWRRPEVHVGSVQGFGQVTNGLRDPLHYVAATRARTFVPAHHDNWLPPVSANARSYEGRLREGLASLPGRPTRLRMITDPDDYVRPLVWSL